MSQPTDTPQPDAAPQAQPPPPPAAPSPPIPLTTAIAAYERKHPLDWRTDLHTPWPHLCLGAAVAGLDFTGNMVDVVTRAEYDVMIAGGLAKLAEARATAKIAEKHVVILPHSSLLHAVVVKRPLGAALRSYVTAMASDVMTDQQKGDMQADHFAQHCLWPADGSPERQDLMDLMPGAFYYDYPQGMQRLVGFSGGEIKKRA